MPMTDRTDAIAAIQELVAGVEDAATWPTSRMPGMVPTVCPCGAQGSEPLAAEDRHGIRVATVMCMWCGTVRSALAFGPHTIDRYYRDYYRATHSALEREELLERERRYASELAKVLPIPSGSTVAEVGAGCGGTLLGLGAGITAIGCEIDPALASYARAHGADVRDGGHHALPRVVDALYAIHVLEHIPQPVWALRDWSMHLPVGGRLVVVVPDLLAVREGHQVREHGGAMRAWWDVAHVWSWTRDTIQIPLALAGLDVIDVECAGPGAYASVGSVVALCRRSGRCAEIRRYCRDGEE
jgi:SAM-dependent methyltransferase